MCTNLVNQVNMGTGIDVLKNLKTFKIKITSKHIRKNDGELSNSFREIADPKFGKIQKLDIILFQGTSKFSV